MTTDTWTPERAARWDRRVRFLANERLTDAQRGPLQSILGNLMDLEATADFPADFMRANSHAKANGHERFQAQRTLDAERQLVPMARRQIGLAWQALEAAETLSEILAELQALIDETFAAAEATYRALAAECGLLIDGEAVAPQKPKQRPARRVVSEHTIIGEDAIIGNGEEGQGA